jgi:hypothetical protein
LGIYIEDRRGIEWKGLFGGSTIVTKKCVEKRKKERNYDSLFFEDIYIFPEVGYVSPLISVMEVGGRRTNLSFD